MLNRDTAETAQGAKDTTVDSAKAAKDAAANTASGKIFYLNVYLI